MKLVALVAGLLAACSGSASRESPRPDARESPRPDARDSAPRATPSTTAREPVRADPTPTADAGSGQPVAAPAPAAPPVRCTATAPPATVAVLQRLPGGLDVAVHAGRTGLVWQEGPIAKVLVLDEAGQPTGQATALNEAGSWAGGAQIFAAAEAFAVTYVHKYGRSLQGCDFVARTVAIDAGGRVREARVVATGGRSWVVARMLGGGHRAVPMAADATQAGPAFDLPGTAFAVDGGRGAAAELRSSPRELVWAGLSCEAAAP